jgi:hypothetical protein
VTFRRPALEYLTAAVALGALVSGCGGETGEPKPPPGQSQSQFERSLARAANVTAADFEQPGGRTLQQVADTVQAGPQARLGTSEYTPGENRLAFGLIGQDNRFLYGKTAVYLAPTPQSKAEGPFPAPASSLIVDPPFRSRGGASESGAIAAIYAARVRLRRPGTYAVLAVTKSSQGILGAPTTIEVARSTRIPEVGEKAPVVSTETLASAGGDVEAIDTRVPPSDMHEADFADVVGKRPVALLFATPRLCQTRVCGPVTDIALQLKKKYGEDVEFIHQEVYVDNDIRKGFRPPLRRFGLRSEPWLFTIDRKGRVTARLEGSFGIEEFERAVRAAL